MCVNVRNICLNNLLMYVRFDFENVNFFQIFLQTDKLYSKKHDLLFKGVANAYVPQNSDIKYFRSQNTFFALRI
jgi:hypothetical protein